MRKSKRVNYAAMENGDHEEQGEDVFHDSMTDQPAHTHDAWVAELEEEIALATEEQERLRK